MLLFLLYNYIGATILSLLVFPIRTYLMGRKKHKLGKRRCILKSIEITFYCFIPVLSTIALFWVLYTVCNKRIKKWVENDPTDPKNIADPSFKPNPSKRGKPVKSRFDIIDL